MRSIANNFIELIRSDQLNERELCQLLMAGKFKGMPVVLDYLRGKHPRILETPKAYLDVFRELPLWPPNLLDQEPPESQEPRQWPNPAEMRLCWIQEDFADPWLRFDISIMPHHSDGIDFGLSWIPFQQLHPTPEQNGFGELLVWDEEVFQEALLRLDSWTHGLLFEDLAHFTYPEGSEMHGFQSWVNEI